MPARFLIPGAPQQDTQLCAVWNPNQALN